MSGPSVVVEVEGDKVAAERIAAVGKRAENVRPVKPDLDALFRQDEEQRFTLNGPGWLPLKESTEALKEAQGWEAGILRRTGELERSLTSALAGEGLELSLMEGGGSTLAFGTSVPYARYHQYGLGVPKRELIDLSPRTIERMTETAQAYIVEGPRP